MEGNYEIWVKEVPNQYKIMKEHGETIVKFLEKSAVIRRFRAFLYKQKARFTL